MHFNSRLFITLFIFIIIFIFSYSVNSANIYFAYSGADQEGLILGSTISSADNFWYLPQMKNFLNGDGFTSDPSDLLQSVRRTPGYPFFYGIHYAIFGEFYAHKIITVTQCLIFALSAIAIGSIGEDIAKNVKFGYFISLAYGTSLHLISFLFMTITEAISPAFVIFSFYFFYWGLVSSQRKNKYFFISAVIAAMATLIRPSNGIILIVMICILPLYEKKFLELIKYYLVISVGFVLLITPWTVRNYFLINKFIPLESYSIHWPYDGQGYKNFGLYRWQLTWGVPQDILKLHYQMLADLSSADRYKSINEYLDKEVPLNIYVGYNRSDLKQALVEYQNCIDLDLKRNNGMRLKWGEAINQCEYSVAEKFLSYSEKIHNELPFLAYFLAPFIYRGSAYIFHSGMHTFKSLQGKSIGIAGKIIKGYAYIVNVLLWIFSALFIISSFNVQRKILLSSFFLFTFIFVIYKAHVEGRYMLSTYPFMYLMSGIFLFGLKNRAKNLLRSPSGVERPIKL